MKKLFTKFSIVAMASVAIAINASAQCSAPTAVTWPNAGDKDIYFHTYANENTVFVGGSDGLVGKGMYANGTWSFMTITLPGASAANSRAGYFYPGSATGFIANDDAKLFKTTDGTTFTELSGFKTVVVEGDVNHLVFAPAPNQNFGLAAAQSGLFVTMDGGVSWTLQTTFTNSKLNSTNTGEFFTVEIKGNKAYAGTDLDNEGQIFVADITTKTTTYTWNAMEFASAGTTAFYMSQEKGRGIAVTPNGTIWNAAETVLLKATNSTSTFQVVTVAGSANVVEIRGVAFYDDNNGAFADGNGDVFVTTNAGASWKLLGNVPSEPKAISFSPMGKTIAIAADVAGTVVGTFINTPCTVTGPISSSEEFETVAQSIYPNPATDIVNFMLNAGDIWSLIDYTGSVVKSGKAAESGVIAENIANLASGLYFVKVSSASSSKTFKLLKL